MASGINFNPASRPLGNNNVVNRGVGSQEQVQSFGDGFQASGIPAPQVQPAANGEPGTVEFKVTKEQLTSAAFQQTLATLASSGVHVAITLINAGDAQPNTTGGGDVTRPEFNQLQNQVNSQGQQINTLQSQYGNIAGNYHKPSPPTYGGD